MILRFEGSALWEFKLLATIRVREAEPLFDMFSAKGLDKSSFQYYQLAEIVTLIPRLSWERTLKEFFRITYSQPVPAVRGVLG